MADKRNKTKQGKTTDTQESSSTKWMRIFIIGFSILIILSLVLSLLNS